MKEEVQDLLERVGFRKTLVKIIGGGRRGRTSVLTIAGRAATLACFTTLKSATVSFGGPIYCKIIRASTIARIGARSGGSEHF